jgi:hypothetical protein
MQSHIVSLTQKVRTKFFHEALVVLWTITRNNREFLLTYISVLIQIIAILVMLSDILENNFLGDRNFPCTWLKTRQSPDLPPIYNQ